MGTFIFRPGSCFEEACVVAKKNRIFPVLFAALDEFRAYLFAKPAAYAEKFTVGIRVRSDAFAKAVEYGSAIEGIHLRIA